MSDTTREHDDDFAFRCSICSLDWPVHSDYNPCPSCLEPTDRCKGVSPMGEDEAASLKRHADFARFYEEWDESHPVERLDPSYEEA